MKTRTLGNSAIEVSAMGLGCMGMSEFYGPSTDDQSLNTLEHAFEIGVTFYDTADTYGIGHNEKLLGRFVQGKRDDLAVLDTVFAKGAVSGERYSAEGMKGVNA